MVEYLWRYPLKSALGESLPWLRIHVGGVEYDRVWACVCADGTVVSAKHPRRWGKLLYVAASVDPVDENRLAIDIPGHARVWAGTAAADSALSHWLGERVTLTREVPTGATIHRLMPDEPGMIPEWMPADSAGCELTTALSPTPGRSSFVDFGAVHLVTIDELASLPSSTGMAEAQRFRPNIVASINRPLEPGDVLAVGNAVHLRVLVPTPRCAVPGAAQPGLEAAPELLRAIGRRRTLIPGLGRAACLGTYAEVLTEGRVSVRDTVRHVA